MKTRGNQTVSAHRSGSTGNDDAPAPGSSEREKQARPEQIQDNQMTTNVNRVDTAGEEKKNRGQPISKLSCIPISGNPMESFGRAELSRTKLTAQFNRPQSLLVNLSNNIDQAFPTHSTMFGNFQGCSPMILNQQLQSMPVFDPMRHRVMPIATNESELTLQNAPLMQAQDTLCRNERLHLGASNIQMPSINGRSELELYRLLDKAKLLQYFPTFLLFGGDDVQQLSEADEEEFLEIMNLVGMTRKPLHIRRLQKALIEWRETK